MLNNKNMILSFETLPYTIFKYTNATIKCFVISAQGIALYVNNQLSLKKQQRNEYFKKNIRNGILKTFKNIVKSHKTKILGIKVICNGKYQLSKSNRKHKATYSIGSLQKTTFMVFNDYGSAYGVTKYGSFGVSV
jgi:ribosomal protein S3